MTKTNLKWLIESWRQGHCPSEALYDAAIEAGLKHGSFLLSILESHLFGFHPCIRMGDRRRCIAAYAVEKWCDASDGKRADDIANGDHIYHFIP